MRTAAWLIGLFLMACSTSSSTSAPPPAQAFVGTWARSGTTTTSCTGQAATQSALTGTLDIVQGADGNSIVSTDSVNSCVTNYSVSANVATATPGQTCTFPNAKGGQSTTTQGTHTLTLSSDGKSMVTSNASSVKVGAPDGGAELDCTTQTDGTFTKQ
jgi:hypothetical protein